MDDNDKTKDELLKELFELRTKLRGRNDFTSSWSPSTHIIVLTNYQYIAYRQRCGQLRARYFFDKKTEFMKVTEVVQRLVEGTIVGYRKSRLPLSLDSDILGAIVN